MKKITAILLTSSALLGGCSTPYSETPTATNPATTQQLKLQAASHWQLIAQDAATRLTASLEKAPLYVRQHEQQSAFEKAFSQQLISSLIEAGYPVMRNADHSSTLTVEVSGDALGFAPGRKQARSLVGAPTLLASGLWVVGEAVTMAPGDAVGAVALGGLALTEAHQWFASEQASGPTPRTEIIVTTRVASANRYLAQVTSAYYTTESDYRLYAQPLQLRAIGNSIELPLHGGRK